MMPNVVSSETSEEWQGDTPVPAHHLHVPVEVLNPISLATPIIVEQDFSQSVSTSTWTDIGIVIQVLALDPLRAKATCIINGTGTVSFCHTENQAQDIINHGVPGSASGATIVGPGAGPSIMFYMEHVAPMWAVLLGASPSLSMVVERRSGR